MNRSLLLRAAVMLTAVAMLTTSCARELPTSVNTARTNPPASGGGGGGDDDASSLVAVTLNSGVSPSAVASDYNATIVEFESEEHVLSLRPAANVLPADLAAQLALDPRVATAEQNGYLQTAEARQQSFAFDDGHDTPQDAAAQPALAALHVESAWAASQGENVRVAILDTGIDPNHPLLKKRILSTWDFVDDKLDVTDTKTGVDNSGNGVADEAWGHGTHVAGIVAMTAPKADLLIARVLDSEGRGDVVKVAAGIRWAVAHGAKVINLSLGTLNRSTAVQRALDDAEDHGVFVTASAGNWGADHPTEYPASSNDAAAIAATDVNATPAPWTSYGSFVALTAPGVAIRSAYPGGTYRLWSGTSMSAPFVSGTAALLLSVHPTWSPERVLERMMDTSRHLVGVPSAMVGKLGDGMLDTGAALRPDIVWAPEPEPVTTPDVYHPKPH